MLQSDLLMGGIRLCKPVMGWFIVKSLSHLYFARVMCCDKVTRFDLLSVSSSAVVFNNTMLHSCRKD